MLEICNSFAAEQNLIFNTKNSLGIKYEDPVCVSETIFLGENKIRWESSVCHLGNYFAQFGFKSKHSTDFCIFTVKSVSKYYTQQHSPSYTCFLDASKAFDKINHFKLFRKLLDRKTPIVIVRIYYFGTVNKLSALNGGDVFLAFFVYLTVLDRVEFYHRNYFRFTLMICLIN